MTTLQAIVLTGSLFVLAWSLWLPWEMRRKTFKGNGKRESL
jgi:hypothetical protein